MSTFSHPIATAVVIAIISVLVLRMVPRMVAIHVVMEPYRRGDYEAALRGSEKFWHRGQVTVHYCFYRGSILAYLGRLEEAEIWLRRNIAMRDEEPVPGKEKQRRLLAIGYTCLGELMLQAGRFDEAGECFEKSIRHVPERGSCYLGMAELCLMRRDNPAEALRWAKRGIACEEVDPITSREVRAVNLGKGTAILAWATAAYSRSASDMASLVTEAINSVGNSSVSSTARVHYHSGCAWAELGDLQASALQYQKAAKLDPQGEWGRAARAALRSAGQSGDAEGEA